jgi:hypothetical protein
MSRKALTGFLTALADDVSLQEELRTAAEGTGDDAIVPTETFVEIAEARGFAFTVDEALGITELGDDELGAVSGGAASPGGRGRTTRFASPRGIKVGRLARSLPELGINYEYHDPDDDD